MDWSKEAAFEKSRRSIREWPIDGNNQNGLDATFRDFVVEALLVSDTVVRDTRFPEIIRVRLSPNSSVYLEALVTFENSSDRDFYFACARNLAQFRDDEGRHTAGMHLDIPLPHAHLQAPI